MSAWPNILRVTSEAPAAAVVSPQRRPADWRRALSAALFAFVLSRALVLVSALATVAIAQQWREPGAEQGEIRLLTADSVAALKRRVLANDAWWYLDVAERGYERRPFDTTRQANWAFFPLHPGLWRVANASGLDPAWGGMLLAHVLFALALVQSHRWVQLVRDADTADRAVMVIALFPTAYFFSLPWSESLFLLLTASSLLAVWQRRWGSASGFSALASATRPTGVLLAALLWWQARDGRRLPTPRFWAWTLLAGAGLFAFMALLWARTGNPLAFADIQVAWGRDGGSFTKHLRRWITDPLLLAEPWNVRWINNAALLLGIAGSAWLWRQQQRGLALFAFLSLLLPWSTGTLVSMGRYFATCLPLFLALACWLRRPWMWSAWLAASSALLAGMTAAFAIGADFAGT